MFLLASFYVLLDTALMFVNPNCSTTRKRAKQQLWAENQVLAKACGSSQMILQRPLKIILLKKMILSLGHLNGVKIVVICSEGILNCETLS